MPAPVTAQTRLPQAVGTVYVERQWRAALFSRCFAALSAISKIRARRPAGAAAPEVDHGHGHGDEPLRDAKGRLIVEMYDSKGRCGC